MSIAALDEVGRLGPARAAVRIRRRLVREDLRERDAHCGDIVGRARHQHRQRRDGGGEQHVVGADVGNQPHLQAEQRAVALRGDVEVADDVAPVRRRDERFRSFLDPLQRHPELLRDPREDVFLGVDVDLGAEPAADFRRDRANLVLAQTVHPRHHRLEDVRVLRGRPDRQQILARLVVRDDAPRFHGVRHEPVVHHPLGDDDFRVGEGLLDGRIVHGLAVRADAGAAGHQRHGQVVREAG